MPASAFDVIGKAYARTEVGIVIMRRSDERIGEWIVEGNKLLVGGAVGYRRAAHHVEVLVPTHAEIQGQPIGGLPIILEVEAELLGASGNIGRGIAISDAHTADRAGSSESIGENCWTARPS